MAKVRLVVRRLTPSLEEGEALSKVEAARSQLALEDAANADEVGRCRVQYFRPGKKTKRRGNIPGRLYVMCPEPIEQHVMVSLRSVFDELGEPQPIVERAPFDKVFRDPSRRDKREGSWLKSSEFAAFEKYEQEIHEEQPKQVSTVDGESAVSKKTSALIDFINSKGSLFSKRPKKAQFDDSKADNPVDGDEKRKRAKKSREKRRKQSQKGVDEPASAARNKKVSKASKLDDKNPESTTPAPKSVKIQKRKPRAASGGDGAG